MAIKSVAVTAETIVPSTGSPTADAVGGSGISILGALLQMFNALVGITSNRALTAAGIAMGTTTTKAKTVNTLTFLIDGVFKSKGATDDFWTMPVTPVPDGSRCIYLFCIDAAGAASVIQGPIGVNDAAIVVPASQLPLSKCIVGTLKVVCAGTTFTGATDNLNKASVTFTFSDGYDASLVGPAQITTKV